MMRPAALVALWLGMLGVGLLWGGLVAAERAAASATAPPALRGAQNEYPLPEYPLPEYPLPPPPGSPSPPSNPSPLRLMTPSPIVRIAGRFTRRGARIRILSVKAPQGTAILVRCRRRGCRRHSVQLGRGIGRAVRFRRFERSFRAGTILEVFVSQSNTIGRVTRFQIRRGRPPKRKDLCLRPGQRRGSQCPDG